MQSDCTVKADGTREDFHQADLEVLDETFDLDVSMLFGVPDTVGLSLRLKILCGDRGESRGYRHCSATGHDYTEAGPSRVRASLTLALRMLSTIESMEQVMARMRWALSGNRTRRHACWDLCG